MPAVNKAQTRNKSARRRSAASVAKPGSTARKSTRAAKIAVPKRRGRPPGSKNAVKAKADAVKKKRAKRGSLLKQMLEKERRIKQRWRVAAGKAKRAMLEMFKKQKAAEKRAATAARLDAARARAVQKFVDQWDRKHLPKQARQSSKDAVPKRRHKRRTA